MLQFVFAYQLRWLPSGGVPAGTAEGLAAVVAGYVTLGAGDITVAPILLIVGYCILVPVALLKGFRTERGE